MGNLQDILQSDFIVYGGISAADNAIEQSIPGGASYTKIVNYDTNGPSRNTTVDFTNGQITAISAGIYKIDSTFSYSTESGNLNTFFSLFVDSVEENSIHFTRKIGVGGDVGNATLNGIISLSANQTLYVGARHDDGSAVGFTFPYMNFNITKVDNP